MANVIFNNPQMMASVAAALPADLISELFLRTNNDCAYKVAETFAREAQELLSDSSRGHCIQDIPMCDHKKKHGHVLDSCDCNNCKLRNLCPIRRFVRGIAEKARTHRTFWLFVNHAYKNNQQFVYSTAIETGYTAGVLGDFVKSFGAGWVDSATGTRIGCIRHLTIIQDRRLSVSEGLSDSVKTDRLPGFYQRGPDNCMVMSMIFVIVRILSIMQRYKMHTTVTFPQTPPSFRSWLEEVYTLRKRLAPNLGRYSQDFEWWTLRTQLSCPDRSVDMIRYDAGVWDLVYEAYEFEHQRHLDRRANNRRAKTDRSVRRMHEIVYGDLSIDIDFS
ncbi:hypothetical protein B5807_06803 [Epicoccum nigrum]|uniref:Uncharacterized protein n=1 Tax=Epicoccum nigrum TaxID=105696 RepID=A0A1Y2LYT7_EPING|nr:hypothetical protein B5807_06803 [Epicoccum nigrum]